MKNIFVSKEQYVLDQIKEHKVCSPMNKLEFKSDIGENNEKRAWLNPENQLCFNSGWYSIDDFNDWMQGKGKIIYGKTNEDKAKFWRYAELNAKYDKFWSIYYNIQHYDWIIDHKPQYGYERHCTTPLKITKTNHDEIIGKMFGVTVNHYVDRIEWLIERDENFIDSKLYHEFEHEMYGIKSTLFNLGLGYYGACNVAAIDNLSYMADLTMSKAYYLALLKANVVMPDFEFIRKYKKY